jgi:membrane fusion protein (multidrug efflux system)
MKLVEPDQEPGALAPAKGERGTEAAPREGRKDNKLQEDKRSRIGALRRHPWLTAAATVAVAALSALIVLWWFNARHYESTDDAFIDARTVSISAQIAGRIDAVPVTDNQLVKTGAPLLRIDPRDYRSALAQAKAELDQAQAQIANLGAQIDAQQAKVDQAKGEVTQAQAALQFSEQEAERYQALLARGAGTEQRAQQARADLIGKRAAFAGAKANATAAEKQLAVLRTQRDSAGLCRGRTRAARESRGGSRPHGHQCADERPRRQAHRCNRRLRSAGPGAHGDCARGSVGHRQF